MSDLENSFSENSPAAANALTGGGQMGALIRATDWSERPPGRIDFWPQSLRLALRIMLDAPNPSFVWWGKARINFYNDAAIPLFGKRHPDALGEPADKVWGSAGDVVGPPSDVFFNEGKAGRRDQVALMVERHGFAEEAYFTFSYSPIADDGAEGGVFCVATEDTERILNERRLGAFAGYAAARAKRIQSGFLNCRRYNRQSHCPS